MTQVCPVQVRCYARKQVSAQATIGLASANIHVDSSRMAIGQT